jgi:hypothetical protein
MPTRTAPPRVWTAISSPCTRLVSELMLSSPAVSTQLLCHTLVRHVGFYPHSPNMACVPHFAQVVNENISPYVFDNAKTVPSDVITIKMAVNGEHGIPAYTSGPDHRNNSSTLAALTPVCLTQTARNECQSPPSCHSWYRLHLLQHPRAGHDAGRACALAHCCPGLPAVHPQLPLVSTAGCHCKQGPAQASHLNPLAVLLIHVLHAGTATRSCTTATVWTMSTCWAQTPLPWT